MRFWLRELVGWGLLAAGLYLFYMCVGFFMGARVVEGMLLSGIAFILFRGGIHLLKIAAAAQVCLAVQEQMRAPRGGRPAPPRTTRVARQTHRERA